MSADIEARPLRYSRSIRRPSIARYQPTGSPPTSFGSSGASVARRALCPRSRDARRRKSLRFELSGCGTGVAWFRRAHGADIVGIKENEKRMTRILLIGQDHATAERLGLQC